MFISEECSQKNCNSTASLRCSDCAEFYCEKCCDAIHKIARGFRTHKISPLSNVVLNDVKERCDEHVNGIKEFHCVTCDKDVCCYCVIKGHSGHDYYQLNQLVSEYEGVTCLLYRQLFFVLISEGER